MIFYDNTFNQYRDTVMKKIVSIIIVCFLILTACNDLFVKYGDKNIQESNEDKGSIVNEHENNSRVNDSIYKIKPIKNKDLADEYFNIGNKYSREKEYSLAIKYYTLAIENNPNDWQAYSNRGAVKGILNQYNEAIKDLLIAAKINPSDPMAYNNIGLQYNKLDDYSNALKYYNKSIFLDENFADALINRGLLYHKHNEDENACFDWNKANTNHADMLIRKYCK